MGVVSGPAAPHPGCRVRRETSEFDKNIAKAFKLVVQNMAKNKILHTPTRHPLCASDALVAVRVREIKSQFMYFLTFARICSDVTCFWGIFSGLLQSCMGIAHVDSHFYQA